MQYPAKPAVFLDRILPKGVAKLFQTPNTSLRFEDRVFLKRLTEELYAIYGDVEFVTTIKLS